MKEKIYLIPGLMNDEKLWSKIKPLLNDEFELVHTPIPKTSDFEEAVQMLDKKFQEDKVNILGFSLGSYLASYYCLKRVNRIKRVFLISGTPSAMNKAENKRRELLLKQLDNLKFKKLSTITIKAHLEKSNRENNELINLIKEMFTSFSLSEYKMQLASTFNRIDIHDKLVSLKLPIKFLVSKGDKLLNKKSIAKLQNSNRPNLIYRVIEGTSHMLRLEKPQLVAKELKDWMNFNL